MRSQVIIENPVIDSPYAEPTRHFKFTDEGITDEIAEGLRRESAYFVPIARPRKRSKQLSIDTEWTQDRIEPNRLVNQIRERVGIWRKGNYRDVTRTTARMLEYWQRQDPLCQAMLDFCLSWWRMIWARWRFSSYVVWSRQMANAIFISRFARQRRAC